MISPTNPEHGFDLRPKVLHLIHIPDTLSSPASRRVEHTILNDRSFRFPFSFLQQDRLCSVLREAFLVRAHTQQVT